MKNITTKRNGTVAVVFLLLLPVLILILGFSIDYAQMQRTRTELRSAMDLSAKSAAIVLAATDDYILADQRAREVASKHEIAGKPLVLANNSVIFGNSRRMNDGSWDFRPNVLPLNAVKVNGSRVDGSPDGPVPMTFGRFYGRPSFQAEFAATAAFVNADVMMVLDRSSSMKLATDDTAPLMSGGDPRNCDVPWADSRWVALEDAVNVFLDDIELTTTDERVGIVTFASDYTTCGSTTAKVAVDQVLDEDASLSRTAMSNRSGQVWGGMTDIDAGIREAHHQLFHGTGQRTSAIKIMVVLTDGQYTEDDPRLGAQLAADDGVLIYTVTFSTGANTADMVAVADIGNGRHLHANTAAELQGAFREISGSIANIIE